MESLFVPYKIALALKELGFDEPCLGWYLPEIVDKGNVASVILGSYITKWNKFGDRLSVPTFSQTFRWFRDKHRLHTWIYQVEDNKFFFSCLKNGRYLVCNSIKFTTYEEAELECLVKLIEIVKEK
jgi:hypothetical protein